MANYYRQSLATIYWKLGLTSDELSDHVVHKNMVLFCDFSPGLLANLLKEQRGRFYADLEHFMSQAYVEHSLRLEGTMPTIEQYIDIRLGSVGCRPQIALAE